MKWAFLFAMFLSLSTATVAGVKCPDRSIKVAFYEIGNVFNAKDGSFHGYDYDVVNEMMKRAGCKYQGTIMKRARIWAEMLGDGSVDITTSAIQTPERSEKVRFVTYIRLKHKAFINSSAKGLDTFDNFMSNKSLKMGVVNGYVYTPYYREKFNILEKENRLVKVVDDEKLFKLLDSQGINAAISYPMVYAHYYKDKNLRGKVTEIDWNPNGDPVFAGISFSKKLFSEEDVKNWQEIISGMKKDGTLAIFLEKFQTKKEVTEALNFE